VAAGMEWVSTPVVAYELVPDEKRPVPRLHRTRVVDGEGRPRDRGFTEQRSKGRGDCSRHQTETMQRGASLTLRRPGLGARAPIELGQLRRAASMALCAVDRPIAELDPRLCRAQQEPPRLMSPRPTKSPGNASDRPNTAPSTSTYLPWRCSRAARSRRPRKRSARSVSASPAQGFRKRRSPASIGTRRNARTSATVISVSGGTRPRPR
jgi:hypothetical protein